MTTTKSQNLPPLPHRLKAAIGGTVAIYGEPADAPTEFRVKYPTGRNLKGKLCYKSEMFDSWTAALKKAKQQKDLLESGDRPADPDTWEKLRSYAALYAECAEHLKNTGLSVMAAVLLLLELLRHMSIERLKFFAAVYAPRIGKVKDLKVEDILPEYRKHLFSAGRAKGKDGQSKTQEGEPKTKDEKRKDGCLSKFEGEFRGRNIGDLLAEPLKNFMEKNWPTADPFNKSLYCLRDFFIYARDMKKALPAQLPTEMDYVIYKEVVKPVKTMIDVRSYARLVGAAYDKEILLVTLLVFRLHLRAEECGFPGRVSLEPRDFIRDKDGGIHRIHVRGAVSKTQVYRDIDVEPELRAVLGELVPKAGKLFSDEDPFARVRDLARALGIKWTKRGARRSCVSHTVCAGEDIKEVAKKDGHTVKELNESYFIPVNEAEAKLYCSIRGSLTRIRTLPTHRRAPAKSMLNTAPEPVPDRLAA